MNKFEKWFTSQKIWVHILLVCVTNGIWLIVWLLVKLRVSYYNYYKVPPKLLYEYEFLVKDSDKFQKSIDEIYEFQKKKFPLYKGMSTDEIKKCGKKVYEADGVKLDFANICGEHKDGDFIYHDIVKGGYFTEEKKLVEFEIGKPSKSVVDEMNKHKDEAKGRRITAEFTDGNYKMVDSNNKVKLYKQPLKVKVKVEMYDKELYRDLISDFFS